MIPVFRRYLSSRVTSRSICNLRTILRAGAERGPAVAYRLVTTIHALAEMCDAATRIVPRACSIAPVAELSRGRLGRFIDQTDALLPAARRFHRYSLAPIGCRSRRRDCEHQPCRVMSPMI